MTQPMIPPDFRPPNPPDAAEFAFEVLGPEHNEADLAAWSSSLDHIRATPGFSVAGWPQRAYSPEENLADLERHRDHHQARRNFAWTVLDPHDRSRVIGCVYVKPDPTGTTDAEVRSWVVRDRAHLDAALWRHIDTWIREQWPFQTYRYARR